MKLVVTGGAGFIGSNFIRYMLKEHSDCTVLCIDSLTYAGNMDNLSDVAEDSRFRFVRADITNRGAVYALFRVLRPDAVVNFAAESHVDRSVSDPSVFVNTNVVGTGVLLDACLEYGVQRFHQVSTDEVYGDLPLDRPDLAFDEESPLRASSPYSASKAGADLLTLSYFRTFGLDVTISRCSNNYGPYQFPEKLIPLMTVNALRDLPLPVYGNGLNVRDWIYVEDHCRAIDMILRRGASGGVYNVGARCELRNIDIVRTICDVLGKPQSLVTYVGDRKGHDLRYALTTDKIERELGWKPLTPFDEGIRRTIKWYADNTAWWERILSGEYRKQNI